MATNLNELDFENYGSWPTWLKLVLSVLLFVAIVGLVIWFDTSKQLDELRRAEQQEAGFRNELQKLQQQVVSLPAYIEQMEQVEVQFRELIKRLPQGLKVSKLVDDISKLGLASGLKFKLIKPLSPIKRDFYRELPIQMQLIGQYSQIGQFVSDLAAMERIITIEDYNIGFPVVAAGKQAPQNGVLALNMGIKAYQYIEVKKTAPKKRKRKAKGR